MSHLSPRFALRLARTADEVAAAQRLRHTVFVEELGARGGDRSDPARGIEADRFDAHCGHLLLLDAMAGGRVVGTTRITDEEAARRAGGFATEEEFDLAPLRASGRPLLELGRTCLAAEHRGGAALHRLWQGLAALVERKGIGLVFGLASFQGTDPAGVAGPLDRLQRDHLAPAEIRPRSLRPLDWGADRGAASDRRAAVLAMPSLVKAYLRLGARVGEGAFLDEAFGCIDLCMVLDTRDLAARARVLYGTEAP